MIQKYSFQEFLTKKVELINNSEAPSAVKIEKIDKIEIPMIQRDYAQGRMQFSVKEKGERLNPTGEKFIKELFAALIKEDSSAQMELDFVYGSIKELEGTTYFYPLDGQQRLTTLFLLYWFIGGVELGTNRKRELSGILCNFYYATRTSANIFCENLVKELQYENIEFLLRGEAVYENDIEVEQKKNLLLQIENLSWFHDSYKLDPTVLAMLNMLDKIQELYIEHHCESIFNNLERLRFYILPLNNFDLTEELYVKMNARGKQLTSFENFKADLQHWLKENAAALALNERSYGGRAMPYDMYFINKMDNEWSQCFWRLQKDSEDKNFDSLFFSFLYKYWLNEYIINSTGTNKGLDKEADFILLSEEPEYRGFCLFERHMSKALIENMQVLLDKIYDCYDEIFETIQPCWSSGEEAKFDLLRGKLGLKERAAFCGAIMYLIKKDYDRDALANWMHIVWNIIENANIDSWRVVAGVMQLLLELVEYSDDIYSGLADDTVVIKSSQSKDTMSEERLKAQLIVSDPDWIEPLNIAEAHPYFKGSVSFLIPEDRDLAGFKHNYQMAEIFFDKNGISEKYRGGGHIFLRALISKYRSLSEIKYHITDVREKENSLKNMLASDPVVRSSIKEWFALPTEKDISKKLCDEVAKESLVPVEGNDFDKKFHEALYKSTDLINWMQQQGAIRYRDNYVSRPASQQDWIYVYGYRNEIIKALTERGWTCENRCYLREGEMKQEIDYFWSSSVRDIDVIKITSFKEQEARIVCSIGRSELSITVNEEKIETFLYHEEVPDKSKVNSFIEKINACTNFCR